MNHNSLLIVGRDNGTNLAFAFKKIANKLGVTPTLIDCQDAYNAPFFIRKINWYFNGKYPTKMRQFNKGIVDSCLQHNFKYLLATGIVPISQEALKSMGRLGVIRINFLTDDPWNAAHHSPRFFKALPEYDVIFSPRRAMVDDLRKLGCRRVEYLPFGYDPDLFYSEPLDSLTLNSTVPDIMFAGGADRDRIPYISALIKAGFNVDLYGSYWERYPETKHSTKGQADAITVRRAIQSAKIALCLVRRANRDGHCMRTFEVPAVGTCMLTEDTSEHREIFGQEGEAVVYFRNLTEMVQKTRWLLDNEEQRQILARNAHLLITQGQHTYQDRLNTMLST
jgi:spore maturation protein CgeB